VSSLGSSVRVTALLQAWSDGHRTALDELIPFVYAELRRIARAQLNGERRDHTLQPTALVNEAYLRVVGLTRIRWQNRAHFLAMSARLMRRILVDHARSRKYRKRGGGARRTTFDETMAVAHGYSDADLIALDDALTALAALDPRKSQVVEMRFFGGLTVQESAGVLQVSPETVMRDWKLAKVWLLRELERGGGR
jgi:RNA polymerase sigma factor (TIGR02999 family)